MLCNPTAAKRMRSSISWPAVSKWREQVCATAQNRREIAIIQIDGAYHGVWRWSSPLCRVGRDSMHDSAICDGRPRSLWGGSSHKVALFKPFKQSRLRRKAPRRGGFWEHGRRLKVATTGRTVVHYRYQRESARNTTYRRTQEEKRWWSGLECFIPRILERTVARATSLL